MGGTGSKEENEEIVNINVPVNSPHMAGDYYETHQYHGGTVKAMMVILLIVVMAILLCVLALKRLCKNIRYLGAMPDAPTVAYTKRGHLPDI